MIRIDLSGDQVRELEGVLRSARDRKLHDRVQIVLMTHRGRPRGQVATDLGVTARTVQRHLNAYLGRGPDGLRPRKAPGPAPRIPESMAAEVRSWVEAGPAACGVRLANWTYAALADHLRRARGIAVGKSATHAFCRRHGVRPYRPTYRYQRADPPRQAAAARDLARLKRGRRGAG